MKRKTVKSTNIISIGYDKKAKVLEIEFKNGVYHYKNVGLENVVDFIFADSLGKFFHSSINKKFEFSKGEYNVQKV